MSAPGNSERTRVCGGCSIGYQNFRAGFTFADARNALLGRQFVGRRGVLGQLYAWKRQAWAEHLATCGHGVIDASDYPWRVAHGRWYLELHKHDAAHLEAEAGEELSVELDGDVYTGVLGDDGRLVVQANWRDLVLPCSWVRVRSLKLRGPVGLDGEEVPF